jgi:hypothetical protein
MGRLSIGARLGLIEARCHSRGLYAQAGLRLGLREAYAGLGKDCEPSSCDHKDADIASANALSYKG